MTSASGSVDFSEAEVPRTKDSVVEDCHIRHFLDNKESHGLREYILIAIR